jgi:hypothetical protein
MDNHMQCSDPWLRRLKVLAMLFLTTVLCAQADVFVTFTNGHVYVFPNDCISGMVTGNGKLTITDLSGKEYSYPISSLSSVGYQLNKTLPDLTSFKFNNEYNYQMVNDVEGTITDNEVNVEVAGIGKWLTPTYLLSDDEARAYADGKEMESKVSRMSYAAPRVITVGYPGDLILTLMDEGQYGFMPFGKDYVVNVDFLTDHATTVPRIDINTVGGVNITSKENYLDAEIIIDGAGVFPSMTDSVKIKGRGNSSWSSNPNAKNPYRLKFDTKKKPLGLHKGKNWVLIANKIYGSMLTNAYGMKASSLIGTPAANHIIPVDLYINGTYKGSYNFTEKVGFSNNSVDLADETVATLLELDKYYDEDEGQKFRTTSYNLPVNIKSPDFAEDVTFLTFDMIESRFNNMISAVENGGDISEHADMDALARYMLANELIGNKEIFHPKSTYCYHENMLSDSCKFIFGPMWDLDWACGYFSYTASSYFVKLIDMDFFNIDYDDGLMYVFFNLLNQDRKVLRQLYEVWKPFMEEGRIDELCDFCIEYVNYANPSLVKSRTAFADNTNYLEQANKAVNWLRSRANLIYDRLIVFMESVGDVNNDGAVSIADVTVLIDYLLSGNAESINQDNADVDGDGHITIADVTALIDMLLASANA